MNPMVDVRMKIVGGRDSRRGGILRSIRVLVAPGSLGSSEGISDFFQDIGSHREGDVEGDGGAEDWLVAVVEEEDEAIPGPNYPESMITSSFLTL